LHPLGLSVNKQSMRAHALKLSLEPALCIDKDARHI
jgi:hypothetical protein